MDIEAWQELGIVSGALLALSALIGLIWRRVVQPVFRTIRRLNQVADVLLGDRLRKIPSLQERLDNMVMQAEVHAQATRALERQLAEHIEWHSARARANGPRPGDRTTPT